MRRRRTFFIAIILVIAAAFAVGGTAMASDTPDMTYNGTDMTYN